MKLSTLLEEKKQPNVAEIIKQATDFLFKAAEEYVMDYRVTIIDAIDDIDAHSTLYPFFAKIEDEYEYTKELEKADEKLVRNPAPMLEKMFKAKHGMSSQKWIDAETKKEIAALPEKERKLFKEVGDELICNLSPHDLAKSEFYMYKQSATGLGIKGYGQEIILRPKFFEQLGLTMEEAIKIFEKHGAKLNTRPKRFKFSPSIYD